jgi:hypothetical protein
MTAGTLPGAAAPPRAAAAPQPSIALLAAVVLLTARAFQFFPGFPLVQELAFVLAPVALVVVAARSSGAVGRTRLFELYVVLMMLCMPLWSGLMAAQAFGQPPIYGVLTWRGYGLMSVSLALLYAMRSGWMQTQDLGRAMVASAWITLGLFAAMSLLLDPADFVEYGIGFIEDRFEEGYRFKFSAVFVIYAMFHYAVRGFREARPALYLLALGFFLFLFGSAGGRILTVSVVLTALLLLWRWGGWIRFLKGTALLALLAGLMIVVGALLSPAATGERLGKFSEAFSVFEFDADIIDDVSAASRVLQTAIALPQIEERPLVGSGRISSQWVEQGFIGFLGVYFFPDDIGIIGMVYQFGIVGTALFALQFVFAWWFARRVSRKQSTTVSDTCGAYIVFLAISSLATGSFVMAPEFLLLLIAVVARQGEVNQ